MGKETILKDTALSSSNDGSRIFIVKRWRHSLIGGRSEFGSCSKDRFLLYPYVSFLEDHWNMSRPYFDRALKEENGWADISSWRKRERAGTEE